MQQKKEAVLAFTCPYCGYQYKFAGLTLFDRRVKCGNCDSKFSVKSEMATISMATNSRDKAHDI